MNSVNKTNCPSHFFLERWLFEDTGTALKAHIDFCPHCRDLIAEIKNEREAFRVRKPFSSFYAGLENKLKKSGQPAFSRSGAWRHLVPLGAVALLMLMLVRSDYPIFGPDGVRLKGNPELMYFIRDGGGDSYRGGRVHKVKPGHRIRLSSNGAEYGYDYVIVFGIEEDGTINRYYPDVGDQSFPTPPADRRLFPDSIVLDASPNSELFLGIFSKRPLNVSEMEARVKSQVLAMKKERQSLKDWNASFIDYPQSTFYLEKE